MPDPVSGSAAVALLTQAVKAAPAVAGSVRVKPEVRLRSYTRFQTATASVIGTLESSAVLQQAAPSPTKLALTTVMLTAPQLSDRVFHRDGKTAMSASRLWRPATTFAAAIQLAEVVAHRRHANDRFDAIWAPMIELLASLYEVRLLGQPKSRAAAEQVVALIAELLDSFPSQPTFGNRDAFELRARYLDRQHAAIEALRDFTREAELDMRVLAGPRWRRASRRNRFQFWRPRPRPNNLALNTEERIERASRERRISEPDEV